MRTAKTLSRRGGCPGWSESSLGAHILLVVSWGGSNSIISVSDHCLFIYSSESETWIPLSNGKSWIASVTYITSSLKGNDRSPESNVPSSNLIKKKTQKKTNKNNNNIKKKKKKKKKKNTSKWAMEIRGPKSNSSELVCLPWLPATLMLVRSKMNELAWRHHFPIISLLEICFRLQG